MGIRGSSSLSQRGAGPWPGNTDAGCFGFMFPRDWIFIVTKQSHKSRHFSDASVEHHVGGLSQGESLLEASDGFLVFGLVKASGG